MKKNLYEIPKITIFPWNEEDIICISSGDNDVEGPDSLSEVDLSI